MTQAYFVECFWPGATESRLAHAAESVMGAPRSGDDARCIDLILIPDDEIVLGLFSGPSAESVRARAERAGIPAERIVRCVRLAQEPNH
jgi:hypothetical protein